MFTKINIVQHTAERWPMNCKQSLLEDCYMARFKFEYTEIDGLLYPDVEIGGKPELDGLVK